MRDEPLSPASSLVLWITLSVLLWAILIWVAYTIMA